MEKDPVSILIESGRAASILSDYAAKDWRRKDPLTIEREMVTILVSHALSKAVQRLESTTNTVRFVRRQKAYREGTDAGLDRHDIAFRAMREAEHDAAAWLRIAERHGLVHLPAPHTLCLI